MADSLSKAKRSWNMGRIKGVNTKPEIIVRSELHKAGFRFRLHQQSLPGKPDIVLPKFKSVVFVHGCFWHRHNRCKYAYIPKSRVEFWNNKFIENVRRDKKNQAALKQAGWKIFIIWECVIDNNDKLKECIKKIASALISQHQEIPSKKSIGLVVSKKK